MGEDLELDVHGVVDVGDLVNGKLARERDAVGSGGLAPCGAAGVVDVRLSGDMRLDLGHEAANLKEEPPVLDDEGVGAELPAAIDEGERLAHLLVLDDDVDRQVHARSGEVRRAAGGSERLVGEVVRLAARVE